MKLRLHFWRQATAAKTLSSFGLTTKERNGSEARHKVHYQVRRFERVYIEGEIKLHIGLVECLIKTTVVVFLIPVSFLIH